MGKSIGQRIRAAPVRGGPPHDCDHAFAESTGIAVDWKGFFTSSHLTVRNYGGGEAAPPPHREGKQSGGWQRRLPNCELRGEPRSLPVWDYGGRAALPPHAFHQVCYLEGEGGLENAATYT